MNATRVMPHSARVLARAGELGVPRIHFGVGTANLLGLMGEAGADVVGGDWRTPLATAIPLVGDRAVQGNLDPAALFAPLPELKARVHELLKRTGSRPGHIFNLGHGILPETPVDHVRAVVDMVREFRP